VLVSWRSLHACSAFAGLAKDFVFNTRKYGVLIITEKFLPVHQKTIKPIDIGGIAGTLRCACLASLIRWR
jgi:hypothetical protein